MTGKKRVLILLTHMPQIKPLTKQDLVSVLKNLPNKKEVKQIVKDEVFNQLSEFHTNMIKPDINVLEGKMGKLEIGLQEVKVEISFLKDEVKGLKADLSTTVSKKEFGQFKRKISKTLPAVSL